ncbi:carbohydrate ABC transporter permease [Paenibacillus sp. CF384]|uniref:carbohydrate ABC transporter permease n=1 Tax=Paenibacillus sp. CF384 TaxID=1884382 RepID=UPI000895BD69|nr:carbohydrate ABC transporter permease [Paenibacillus sp. CF384]SDW80297.1 carbohydrate ABC transporter membrane protein 2, CUT1 family [Paenibacillus sp. CF384]
MKRLANGLKYIIVITLAIVWIAPVVLVLMNSTKSIGDFMNGSMWAWPKEFHLFQNIEEAMNAGKLTKYVKNSFTYGVVGATASILISAFAAYGLVVLRLKGSFYWFLLIYSGTIFPFQMYLVPLFSGFQKVGIYDTFLGMCLFYTAICIPFCVFLLRNFMTTISREYVEAAQLDGYSTIAILFRIIFPFLVPPISVLFLFQFTFIWNDLIFGLILTRSDDIRPIMSGLAAMQGTYISTGITTLMAGILVTSIPTLILFFALQKNFIKGMQITVKS